MSDIKFIEQEEYLKGIMLLKMVFPEFWINAYKKKNNFFNYVFSEAKQHIEKRELSEEYLKEDHCKELWERHCDCCFKEITIGTKGDCYCTEDCFTWICSECYKIFKDKLMWQATEVQDIPKEGVINVEVKVE